MSCKQWEESIYLYDELSDTERLKADHHLQQCEECRMLFQSLQPMKIAMKQMAEEQPSLQEPELLTNRIMRSLPESGSAITSVGVISKLIDSVFTRYALAVCSLLIIISFLVEQQTSKLPATAVASVSKENVILHSNEFLKTIKEKNPEVEKTSAASLYACAKTNDCNYAIVKYFKQKRQHETL